LRIKTDLTKRARGGPGKVQIAGRLRAETVMTVKWITYVNRLRRAGVPREAAMRLVNHSSELIHSIYQRERVEDVAQWRDAVRFPA
jgi:hypothetical protein